MCILRLRKIKNFLNIAWKDLSFFAWNLSHVYSNQTTFHYIDVTTVGLANVLTTAWVWKKLWNVLPTLYIIHADMNFTKTYPFYVKFLFFLIIYMWYTKSIGIQKYIIQRNCFKHNFLRDSERAFLFLLSITRFSCLFLLHQYFRSTSAEKNRTTYQFFKNTGRGLVHFCRRAMNCRSHEKILLEANESRNATWK